MKSTPCLCTTLRRAAQISTAFYDRSLAPSGLKITMYRLLKNLVDMDRPSISELARQVGLERSTLGRNIRVLERAGYVCLDNSVDERERVVVMTPSGKKALAKARPLWIQAQKEMQAQLGNEAETLLALLNGIRLP